MADDQRTVPEVKNSYYISLRATKRWELTHGSRAAASTFFDLETHTFG